MSYRTIKRLLGETSLERKCRFLFGGALLLLITASFYVYAMLNLRIVTDQYRTRAQLLISQDMMAMHLGIGREEAEEPTKSEIKQLERLSTEFKPADLRETVWKFIRSDWEKKPRDQRSPSTSNEYDILKVFPAVESPSAHRQDRIVEIEESYEYYAPIYASTEQFIPDPTDPHGDLAAANSKTCYDCHKGMVADLQPGGLLGVAKISFDRLETSQRIARNNAILIAMAIVTAFLAMLALYAIVRYVIVKPVQHLKEVSDSVAQGDLDQRADIRTGDEFEELSHAFNRMLRHLMNTQEELRLANTSLDGKVDELARANLSLHQMNKVKNEFLATMSHELRTPLNSILGFSDVLASAENLNERQKKYLANIQTSGRSLLSLINDILDLAKIEAGKMERNIVEFPVGDLIERATAAMVPLAEKKNIDLQWSADPTLPPLRQDEGKLQQVLYNLLSNAVKFTPEGGRIRVTVAAAPEERVDIIAADTGIGIPLEDQALIFEKFRQGRSLPGQESGALTREYEGTGLGLSIVKEIARLLGGEVFLESEFGKGSTFTVRVPLELSCPLERPEEPAFDLRSPSPMGGFGLETPLRVNA
jgi:two-component system, NarL family, sensor histidine kinase BarA